MKAHFLFIFILIFTLITADSVAARKKCRKKCAKNEAFICNKCKEATCGEEPKVECVQSCNPKQCRCKFGYFRYNGICIPEDYCPLETIVPDCKVDEFEHLQLQTFDEIPTCRNRDEAPPSSSSSSKIDEEGKPRCVCDRGRVKNAKGKCILPKDCTETDNNHIYEKTSTTNSTTNNNKENNNNDKSKDSFLPTIILENGNTNYLQKTLLPLPKVPRSIDEKMPKIFLIPPPPEN